MQANLILYPVMAMVMLTAYVGMRMLALRYRAVRNDSLNPAYFLLMRGGKPPEYMMKMERHYANLFEQPVLFYVAVILVFIINRVDTGYLVLAWLYVLLRISHMIIHTTYNNLRHRRYAFLGSTLVLFSIWLRLFLNLLT